MSRPEEVRIRKLLQEGKVTSEEAGRLLNAITKRPDETAQSSIHIVPGKHRRGAGRRSLEIRLDKRLATPARAIAGIVIGGGITAATLLFVLPVVGFVVGLVLGLALALVAVLGISLSVVILSGSLTGVFGAPLAALRERLGIRRRGRIGGRSPQGVLPRVDRHSRPALQQGFQLKQRRSSNEPSGGDGDPENG